MTNKVFSHCGSRKQVRPQSVSLLGKVSEQVPIKNRCILRCVGAQVRKRELAEHPTSLLRSGRPVCSPERHSFYHRDIRVQTGGG